MNVAQHAEQILTAWKEADAGRFELELDEAMRSCERPQPANFLESEQREVLASVVERLRGMQRRSEGSAFTRLAERQTSQSFHAGFTLLEHLRRRAAA